MIIQQINFVAALSVLSIPTISLASDDEDDEADDDFTERCITARSIKGTDVLSDSHIVFVIQGNKIYLNTLRENCAGLSRDRRFSYVLHSRRLCELDRINVLNDSGFGMQQGRACKLGRFRRVTADEITRFNERLHELPKAKQPEPLPPQEVISEDAEDEDSD